VVRMSYEAALRNNPGLRALNGFIAAAAGDDAPAVMAERAEREKRSEQARAAQASGQTLETELEAAHELARTLGLADIEKLSVPVAVEQNLGDGRLIGKRCGRVGADYRGVLKGGVAVVIEAKNAGRGRLALVDNNKPRFDGVKRHQAAALNRCVKLGGVALLVVRFKRREDCRDVESTYAVPWDAVCGLDSLGPDDVSAWLWPGVGLYFERWMVR
jgi:penicillin-binding protein-related factor A (putative recombinase)